MERPSRGALATLSLLALLATACAERPATGTGREAAPAVAADLAARLDTFAPTVLEADVSHLDATDREVLDLLIEASRPLDEIFLMQANRDNERWRRRLELVPGELGDAARLWFDVHKGIYERHRDWQPFVEGAPPRPAGGGFYPPDMTREELEAFIAERPDREAELVSLTTLVVRDETGLAGVPYSTAFSRWLEPAKTKLSEAATRTHDETLRTYLRRLVEALGTDRYTDADMAWMDLDGALELTYGPYEVYEDELFNYKAAFESFVTVVDPEESRRLARLKQMLPAFENSLPIEERHKNLSRGAESPIRVADLVFSAGDARAGIQTIAFNLPNDEEVRERKGSKKVLLRNVMAAKFDTILAPIAERVLVPAQAARLSRDAFLDEVLHHELSHGLGPGRITVGSTRGEVREFLQEHYSPIEEAKADVVGLWTLLGLSRAGEAGAHDGEALAATYVAGLFRAARWGTGSAHGKGAALQFALLRDAGALQVVDGGRVRIDLAAFPGALRDVTARLLMLQATGDRDGAAALLAQHGSARPEMRTLLERLDGIPIDIRPIYPAAGESR